MIVPAIRTAGVLPILLVAAQGAAGQARLEEVTTPEAALGFELGADYHLATYAQLSAYWERLASESDRMALDTIGFSEAGRPQLMAILTSPENHRALGRYREIAARLARAEGVEEEEARRLAEEGRAVVWIDGGLHADEVLGAQQLMRLVYDMVSLTDRETERFLADVIVLAVHANPDGMELVSQWYMRADEPGARSTAGLPELYQRYAGHDNNRDFFMGNLAETRNMNRVAYREWFPQIVYNHHQTGPAGTVMFSPPFRDPPNYNIHPLVLASLEQLGGHMHARFISEDKPGVTTRSGATYSTWWNGGLRTTPYFHNMIGLLTETIGHPTPMAVPFLAERQLATHDLPMPVEPGAWHFGRSIEYSQTANRAVLDFASRNREVLLLNIWKMGRDAIERGRRDSWTNTPREIYEAERLLTGPGTRADFERMLRRSEDREPRGYVIPSSQADFATAKKMVDALLGNGVSVHRALRPFTAGDVTYPEGSFVVRTDQAFASHVFDMFEPQQHPDDFAYPGGPPIPPYDLTGWTLALQMGVEFDRILEGLPDPDEGSLEPVSGETVPHEPGSIEGEGGRGGQGGFLLDARVNDAVKVVNALLAAGSEVYAIEGAVSSADADYPEGAFFVAAGGHSSLRALVGEHGVDARAVGRRPDGAARRLRTVRVGLYDEYGGSMPSGWTRLVLERFGFDFSVVFPPELDGGGLEERYDVLIFPSGAIPEPGRPTAAPVRPADIPEEYRDRFGRVTAERTIPAVLEFVRRGGTVIAVGTSTSLAQHAGLPVTNHLVGADGQPWPPSEYYVPGSLLEVGLQGDGPVLHGLGERLTVMFNRSPVLRLEPGAEGVRVLGRYGANPLRSGWAWGQEKLEGGVALAEAALGRGTLYLFTPEITFRGQPHGTFPLLFNAIYRAGTE